MGRSLSVDAVIYMEGLKLLKLCWSYKFTFNWLKLMAWEFLYRVIILQSTNIFPSLYKSLFKLCFTYPSFFVLIQDLFLGHYLNPLSYPHQALFIYSFWWLTPQSQSQFGFGHCSVLAFFCLSVWEKCGHQHLCVCTGVSFLAAPKWQCRHVLGTIPNSKSTMAYIQMSFLTRTGLGFTFLRTNCLFSDPRTTDRRARTSVVLRSFRFLGSGLGCTIISTITTWMQCLCSIIVAALLTHGLDSLDADAEARTPFGSLQFIDWHFYYAYSLVCYPCYASFLPKPPASPANNNKFPICLWHWP